MNLFVFLLPFILFATTVVAVSESENWIQNVHHSILRIPNSIKDVPEYRNISEPCSRQLLTLDNISSPGAMQSKNYDSRVLLSSYYSTLEVKMVFLFTSAGCMGKGALRIAKGQSVLEGIFFKLPRSRDTAQLYGQILSTRSAISKCTRSSK